jgi:hypothetical protein
MGPNSLIKQVRPAVGFSPLYTVDEFGIVENSKGKVLKQYEWENGYKRVYLFKEGKYYLRYVHRLVAESFVICTDDNYVVNHKDGDKHNNHKDNLEWVSQSYNRQHAYDIGLQPKGEDHPNTKLGDATVKFIRSCKDSNREMAELFGVSSSHISGIRRGTKRKEIH